MVSPKSNVYQIDFTAVASGKRIASSKRRVRWRFGFANTDALNNGETGTACRGEEHDVTLVWSITSGKRLILADGQEVHYSHNRNGILDFSWTMKGNHVLKIVAHASPPMAPTPGWRQYDFFVDGQSFFSFPKVYRLGLATNDPRGRAPDNPARLAETGQRMKGPPPAGRSEIARLEAPTNAQEEEAYLQAAISESIKDASTMKAPENASTDYGDLLDFGSVAPEPVQNNPFGAAPAAAAPAALPPSTTAQPGYPPAQAPAQSNPFGAANPYGAPPPADANPYGAPPPAANGQYPALPAPAPAAAGADQFAFAAAGPAPPPANAGPYGAPAGSFGGPDAAKPAPIETQQQNGVATPPAQVTPQAQATPSSLGFASPPGDFSGFSPQAEGAAAAAPPAAVPETSAPPATPQAEPAPAAPEAAATEQPKLTMNSLSGQGGLLGDGSNGVQANGSMADQAYNRLAMMDSFTLGAKPKAENPFEANNNVVGGHKTLADMQSKKDASSGGKEIMKAAPAGAMVVSNTQNGSWGGQYQQPQMGQMGGMQPQMGQPHMGGPPPLGQQQMNGMQPQMGGPPPLGQPQMGGMQPQMGGPPPLGQPQMGGMQPQMGGPPPLGQPQMGGMQPQMGGPPPLGQPQMGFQQQQYSAFGQPATQG